MLRRWLSRMKEKSSDLNYGRDIVTRWVQEYAQQSGGGPLKILDIGVGGGTDLMNARQALAPKSLECYGVESWEPNVIAARKNGITVYSLDIEKERIPVDDAFFDMIIANQVIEHTKELFWIFSEISRVLKPGGILIIGVPSMSSFHNRIALLFGEQPTCVEVLSAHVRGFTYPSLKRFICTDGYFEVDKLKGSNFYPFPRGMARFLSSMLPTFSVTMFLRVRRTTKPGCFADVLKTRFFETNYFTGQVEQPAAKV